MDAAMRNRSERINIRLKTGAKELMERAAGFEDKTVSHFMLSSALDRAEKTVREHETMALNLKQSRIFFEALSEPARFNRKLTKALEEHERRVAGK